MSKYKNILKDGQYSNINATLIIKDGKAAVILHDLFGLDPGTEIPLAREEGTLLIENSIGSETQIFDGHGII